MDLETFFIDHGFTKIHSQFSAKDFGNSEASYAKDGILFIVTVERGIKYVELQHQDGKERIYMSLLFESDQFFTEAEIIRCLSDRYNEIVLKMHSLSDAELNRLKRRSVRRRLNVSFAGQGEGGFSGT